MAKYSIAIVDRDEAYCERLVNYLIENESKRINASYITEDTYLKKFIEDKSNKVDVLLISPELYEMEEDYGCAKVVAILSSGRVSTEYANLPIINKYQMADKLVEQILSIYTHEFPEIQCDFKAMTNTKVIGFYSPITRSGKTTCALNAAKTMAEQGKTTLYLNLEEFPSTENYFECTQKNAMADIMYFAKERKKNFASKLAEKMERYDDNIDMFYISPFVSMHDMDVTTIENWEFFFEQLKNSSRFDYVMVDFSSTYDVKLIAQLKLCDQIVFITSEDMADKTKEKLFLDTISLKESDLEAEKFIRVMNQARQSIPYQVAVGQFGIPHIPAIASDMSIPRKIDTNSVMSKILRNIIEKM